MQKLQGISVSRGINIGPVYQFRQVSLDFETIKTDDPQKEWKRYQDAILVTHNKLEHFHDKAVAEIGTDEAAIFHAHMMILEDPDLTEGVQSKILFDGLNAEAALTEVSEEYCRMLEEIDDEYIRARVLDIRDVRTSLLRTLLGIEDHAAEGLTQPSVIVSRDLTPSDCLSIDKRLILGFCTIAGGTTSHTAILARSLDIPAIVGAPEAVLSLEDGESVILDGYTGDLLIQPDEATLEEYQRLRSARLKILEQALSESGLPAVTEDGHRVEVFANVGSDSGDELVTAVQNGAEGVGLLRTEFIYLDCTSMPSEELQFEKYKAVVEAFGNRPVILRTLDIGGDKQLPYLELPYELNPFLGVRGLRLCLRNLPLFKTQLRAALRAAAFGHLQLMFPMVTKASEIHAARKVIDECRAELSAEGKSVPEKIDIGIMIEIPAAAIMADHLAREVDFFSIGTNDLSQYTLAVDRTNTNLADLANAYDPAVLTLISMVVNAAHKYGKSAGICGELAGDPLAIPILVGLGLDELSMNPPAVPTAKQIIRRLNFDDARQLAQEVLKMETPANVRRLVGERLPYLLELG
jgi:phosphotransferase system enzyme I (PtsI)